MKSYTHLTTDERVILMLRRGQVLSLRSISRHLGRYVSSLGCELKRNGTNHHYDVNHACDLTRERRSKARCLLALATGERALSGGNLHAQKGLISTANRRQTEASMAGQPRVSRESRKHLSSDLRLSSWRVEASTDQLPALDHGKRRLQTLSAGRGERYPADLNIYPRPPEVEGRLVLGHWESDLIMGASNRSAVATMVERTSRFVVLAKLDAPTAECAAQAITREMSRMARHQDITAQTGMKIYFADPHNSWQRGSNENTNGLLRQYLSKGTDLSCPM